MLKSMGVPLRVSPANCEQPFHYSINAVNACEIAIYACNIGFQANIQALTACEHGPGSLEDQNSGGTDPDCRTV